MIYPFTTPIGFSRATGRAMPAVSVAATTSATSLYASDISSSTVLRPALLT